MRRPWSKEEFPAIAGWLAANVKPLALLVESSKRPRWYHPQLCGDSDEGKLLDASLDHLNLSRDVARALVARAMLRLKAGQVNECWADLLACHRLARLIGQGPGIIDGLTGVASDGLACQGDQALLQHARLTAAQAEKMRDELAKLSPLPKMADKLDVSERFVFLDLLATCARQGFDSLSLSKSSPAKATVTSLDERARASLDWDVMLRMGNSWFDRIVAASRKSTRSKKLAEIDNLERELKALSASNSDPRTIAVSFLFDRRSELIGNIYICLMLPALLATINAEDRGTTQEELIELGFALEAYRADRGSFPQQLDDLAPRYVARLPTDAYANDGALHYRRQGSGYLLYSVGRNGRDDGGHGIKEGPDWDDLSVRVP